MSSWRVLELAEQPDGDAIPQLLVKPSFKPDSYTVYLTCLTNIWSEDLDLNAIIDRAAEQQSPIEVTARDTAQLAILLDNINASLDSADGAECRLTREGTNGIMLHTSVRLPAPLDSLTWKFHLRKRSPVTLRNELILPLLVSSHIQYERINDLVTTIENKDKAIARMADQFESSNLDLAAAFPSIGGLKTGRKLIKREQAARHLPALRTFQQHVWREETAQLADSDVTTLGLFQEALVQCTPQVPLTLQADDGIEDWLSAVPTRLTFARPAIKIKPIQSAPVFHPPKHGHESSPVDDDTEDEFEVHENFKTRKVADKITKAPEPPLPVQQGSDPDEESTDDEDLDAPSRSQDPSQSQPRRTRQRTKSSSPGPPAEPATSPPPVSRPKGRGFRIGGKAKTNPPATLQDEAEAQADVKKRRKPFKIGGKKSVDEAASSQQRGNMAAPTSERVKDAQSLTPRSSPPPLPQPVDQEVAPVEEVHEETPEEKAERKRAELKRRNEEITKKQAQHKKKKRF